MTLDETDIELIKELKKDARQPYREIAQKLGVAEGTVHNRVAKLQEQGIIKRFIPDIDYSKLGYDLTTVVGVTVQGGRLPDVEEMISKEPNVSAVYDVTGEYDCIFIARFKTREELNLLIKRILSIKHVNRSQTMLVLNTVKDKHGVDL